MPFSPSLRSSVGKKMIMGLTGLLLVLFLIEHLTGNFLLLLPDKAPYNKYAHFLTSFGWLLIAAELILLAVFLAHVLSAISVTLRNRQARPQRYVKTAGAGPPSRKNLASLTMIYSGVILFVFLAIHLKTFKFGPYYPFHVDGQEMRDLYRLVAEVFSRPGYVVWYAAAMILLGFHLRHGFWSAFQSLGLYHPRWTPVIYGIGIFVAFVLALGFIGIPIWIYVREVLIKGAP